MTNKRNGYIPTLPLAPRRQLTPAAPDRHYWGFDDEVEKPEGTGHIHWGVSAFASWSPEGALSDSLMVEVEAPDEATAIARAMAIVQRPLYRISWVKETCSQELAKKE